MARTWVSTDQIHAVYNVVETGQTLTTAPTSLEDEINYLRQQVRDIIGQGSWTATPDSSLNTLSTRRYLIPIQPIDGTGQSAVTGTAGNTFVNLTGITSGTADNSESGTTENAFAAQLSTQSNFDLHNVVTIRKRNSGSVMSTVDGNDVVGVLQIVGATATVFPATINGDAVDGTALRVALKYRDNAGVWQNYTLTSGDVADGGFDVVLSKIQSLNNLSRYAFLWGSDFLDVAQDSQIGDLNFTSNNFVTDYSTVTAAISALDAALGGVSGTAIDNLQTYVGSTGDTDIDPAYSSTVYVTQGSNLTAAIGTLDASLNTHVTQATDAHDASAISYINTTSGLTATEVQAAIDELDADLDSHLADTVDAHDASAISITSGTQTSTGAATADVEAALVALDTTIDAHIADSTDPHGTTLTQTNLTVTGNTILGDAGTDTLTINATLSANLAVDTGVTIDGVDISQLSADFAAHLADTVDAHDASAISYINTTSGLTATDAQAAIDELDSRLDTLEAEVGTTTSEKLDDLYLKTGVQAYLTAFAWTGTTTYITATTNLKAGIEALDVALNAHAIDDTDPHGTTLNQTNLIVGTSLQSPNLTSSGALAISATTSMTFDDANLTAPLSLTNTATALVSSAGGIVDAINEATRGSVKQRGYGDGTGNATVNLNTVCGITSYFSNYGGAGVGDTSEGFYMEVYVNGILQRPGAGNDYREDTTTGTGRTSIQFIGKTPNANDVIGVVVYRL